MTVIFRAQPQALDSGADGIVLKDKGGKILGTFIFGLTMGSIIMMQSLITSGVSA